MFQLTFALAWDEAFPCRVEVNLCGVRIDGRRLEDVTTTVSSLMGD